ncbi:hypothetical protein [Mastigocoleus testarum]|uniref:hypothetical protein n=1 Tax=Mastigocoleus testarum TaxID=996925 RepID=UPI00137A847D|nr:hypothetical protein [Mastigocoleus testarum]
MTVAMLSVRNTNSINHCNRFSGRDVAEANADAAGSATSLQNLSVSLFFQIGISSEIFDVKTLFDSGNLVFG